MIVKSGTYVIIGLLIPILSESAIYCNGIRDAFAIKTDQSQNPQTTNPHI